MDVWAWVFDLSNELNDAGRADLAEAIRALPHAAVGGELDRAEALATEVTMQARALDLPWLEVFARHWRMQGLHTDGRGASTVGEATAMFEFANRESTERCPQSVCTTQDLCIGYGLTDGPGYAAERVAVATETLGRIDPTWGCWSCLTTELVDGLLEGGRVDEAEVELERRWAALLEAGEVPSLGMEETKAELLIARGRHDDALDLIDDLASRPHDGSSRERKAMYLDLLRADALSRLGRLDEAVACLPAPELVARWAKNQRYWVQVVEGLVQQGALPNQAELGGHIHGIVEHYRANGSWRMMFDTAASGARLATARGAAWVAAEALGAMRAAQAELRVDAGAAAEVAAVDAGLATIERLPLPVPAEDLLSHLHALEEHDIEREIEWLGQAIAAHPDADDLVLVRAHLLAACQRDDLSRTMLDAAFDRRPGSEVIAGTLGELVLRGAVAADIEAMADRLEPDHPTMARWVRARWSAAEERWEDVAARCAEIVAEDDDALNTRRLWARAARRLGDHEAAVRLLTEVIERADDERSTPADHWERMVDATILGRWDDVHESARALGMTIGTPSGPIDEQWELVTVELAGDSWEPAILAARRTGPVTARVVEISADNHPQRLGDLVVFDASPLTSPPDDADDEAFASFVFRYASVATIEPGGYTGWVLDGVDPGEARYWPFVEALDAAGMKIWIFSGDRYRVTSPAGEDLPGIYGRVATPAGMDPVEADALLTRLTASWDHPLMWIDLAAAAGADVARHQQIIDDYGL